MDDKMPTNIEAISKLSNSIAAKVFELKGKEIIKHIERDPIKGEHPAEAGLRLGLAAMFKMFLS